MGPTDINGYLKFSVDVTNTLPSLCYHNSRDRVVNISTMLAQEEAGEAELVFAPSISVASVCFLRSSWMPLLWWIVSRCMLQKMKEIDHS